MLLGGPAQHSSGGVHSDDADPEVDQGGRDPTGPDSYFEKGVPLVLTEEFQQTLDRRPVERLTSLVVDRG